MHGMIRSDGMDKDDAIEGLVKTYAYIWNTVNGTEDFKDMTPEMKKDIATSVFIQILRRGK